MISFLKKMLELCRPYKTRLVLGILTGLLAGFVEPLLMFCVGLVVKVTFHTEGSPSIIDKYPWAKEHLAFLTSLLPQGHNNTSSVATVLIILTIPLVMLVRGVLTYLNIYLLQWVSVRAITDLRIKIFSHLLQLPLSFLSRISTGEIISRITGDTSFLQSSISNLLVVIIKDPATLIALAAVLLVKQPVLTVVSLIVLPVCVIPIAVYSRKVRQSSSAIQDRYADLSKVMHESFTANRIIKAYNLERNVIKKFSDVSFDFIGHYMRVVRSLELPGPLIEFLGAVGVTFIFGYILFISHKKIDAGDFVFFVGCVFSMYRPIKTLTRLHSQLGQAESATARVFELLATPSVMPEPTKPVPLKAAGAEIKFDHINFNYDTKPVLRDFSLTIKAGQMVALVGQSGSGKTTVTNLLLRFYDPQSGEVTIGGVNIRNVTSQELRNQIAVVTQDTLLFDDSIIGNIELGRPGATEAEVVAAAKHAYAHDFIMEKEGGYRALIGEKGTNLSGGQKQRLAIARAIVRDAPILILDEATSALDTEAEKIVQRALEELMEGRTTLCIAHRLSTIQRADVIVVMEQGRIVEQGRHDELLAKNGVYRRLYELQFNS